MSTTSQVLGWLGTLGAILIWSFLVLLGASLLASSALLAVAGVWVLIVFYGWLLAASLHYQHCRQDELLHVLASVVEAKAPLAPALWAYLDDRPRGAWREAWVFLLLLFVVPGYYWFRHRRHSFDSKVARVAHRLEHGYALADALQDVRGVVPRDAVLAVAVGESTGRLAQSLRGATQTRIASVWMELLPRVLYPFMVLKMTAAILGFWAIYIAPKIQSICYDMGTKLSPTTELVMEAAYWFEILAPAIALGFLSFLALVLLIFVSSHLRWYCPVIGRLYQMYVQARVLRMLAVLIETQKPVPQALALLVETRFGSALMRGRLRTVADYLEQGDPLADSLRRSGLLPRSMVPLVQSAEKVGNLAWALRELAETRANRLIRLLRQVSTLLWPVIVSLIGVMVAFIAVGMFRPLIDLMERMME